MGNEKDIKSVVQRILQGLYRIGINPCVFCEYNRGGIECLTCGEVGSIKPDFSNFKLKTFWR